MHVAGAWIGGDQLLIQVKNDGNVKADTPTRRGSNEEVRSRCSL
jgi:hypothetical protein